jgi:sec-independent protein translocase protein TatA
MFGLGMWEILLIAVLIFIFFGSSRLPELGTGLGKLVGKLRSASASKEELEPPSSSEPPEKPKP